MAGFSYEVLRWNRWARINIPWFMYAEINISRFFTARTRNPHATGHFWSGLRNKHSKNWFTNEHLE